MNKSDVDSYSCLGSIRFILAFLVFCSHAEGILSPFSEIIHPGSLGVFVFFVVSGYIIVGAIEKYYNNRPAQFILNRAIRLFPTFWICYALSIGLMAFFNVEALNAGPATNIGVGGTRSIVLGLTLLGGILDPAAFSPNPPAWSINIEWIFYLIVAGSVLIFRTRPRAGMLAAGIACMIMVGVIWRSEASLRFFGGLQFSSFFICGGAHWYVQNRQGGYYAKVLLAISMVLIVMFMFSADGYLMRRDIVATSSKGRDLAAFIILYALFTFAANIKTVNTKLRNFDKVLGDITYPLYLCHIPLICAFYTATGNQSGIIYFSICFFMCIAASYAIFIAVERPLYRIRDFFRGQALSAP